MEALDCCLEPLIVGRCAILSHAHVFGGEEVSPKVAWLEDDATKAERRDLAVEPDR